MLRTLILVTIMAVAGIIGNGNVLAADIEIDDAMAAALAAEPPLTQDDIDKFVKYFPEIEAAHDTNDAVLMQKILRETQWTETRMVYVIFKTGYTCAMLAETETEAFFREFFPEFMPLENERALIKQNIDKVSGLIENQEPDR